MPGTETCCCCKTAKEGCVACGLYTLLFYLIKMSVASYHISLGTAAFVYLLFAILVCILSISCVLSSILLFAGILTSYNPIFGVVFIIDVFICSLNVYCLLCVSSRYQDLSLELHNAKFQEEQRAISMRRQGTSEVRTTNAPLKKNDGSSLLPGGQRKGSASTNNQLLPELSTISEERSLMNFNRKLSTDVSSFEPDSQALSPSDDKRAFPLSSSSPTHSTDAYCDEGLECRNECLSLFTKDGHLCPPRTGNGSVYCSQFELVNLSISEEPSDTHL
ncbi:uncharacterized protein LOC111085377 isoform X2 [Limulus polyphemus]|uniref:Uncharacterized protein LOC111085377 isoform X2 n=1 Tax=Limulus polyphemus TaxID=6850 RepID=A0ABM1S6W0_LIMPO|nr:uncharacterized protein LOC111085377 isoform X2 [Limulus polyphemus]